MKPPLRMERSEMSETLFDCTGGKNNNPKLR